MSIGTIVFSIFAILVLLSIDQHLLSINNQLERLNTVTSVASSGMPVGMTANSVVIAMNYVWDGTTWNRMREEQ